MDHLRNVHALNCDSLHALRLALELGLGYGGDSCLWISTCVSCICACRHSTIYCIRGKHLRAVSRLAISVVHRKFDSSLARLLIRTITGQCGLCGSLFQREGLLLVLFFGTQGAIHLVDFVQLEILDGRLTSWQWLMQNLVIYR